MAKKDFLICYDIRDKKRLAKIAKIVETDALRIQRSVYFYAEASKQELNGLVKKILMVLDEKVDDLRIYTIQNNGIHLGQAIDLNNPFILL